MRTLILLLCLSCCAAVPVEAEKPKIGQTLESPTKRNFKHRIQVSHWLIYTHEGWKRTFIIDNVKKTSYVAYYNPALNTVSFTYWYNEPIVEEPKPLY